MFSLTKDDWLPDSSLRRVLPNVSTDRIGKLFGEQAVRHMDPFEKYSDTIIVKHDETGEKFSLYMCYGVWRIGGRDDNSKALALLEQYINAKDETSVDNEPSFEDPAEYTIAINEAQRRVFQRALEALSKKRNPVKLAEEIEMLYGMLDESLEKTGINDFTA